MSKFPFRLTLIFLFSCISFSVNAQKKVDCTNMTPMQLRQVDQSDCMSENEVARFRAESKKNKLIASANSVKNDVPLTNLIKMLGTPIVNNGKEVVWANGRSLVWDGTRDGAVRFLIKDNKTYNVPNEGIISAAGRAQYLKEEAIRVAQEKENIAKDKADEQRELLEEKAAASNAVAKCDGKTMCTKLFSLVQVFIHTNSSQKIQLVTDTIIETYNPTELGSIGMRAIKVPKSGDKEEVTLEVMCRENSQITSSEKLCRLKRIDVYSRFKPYIDSKLLK